MTLVDCGDAADGAALVVEDLVRDMGCHAQPSHPRGNRPAEIMENPSPDARDLVMSLLGGAEVAGSACR